MVPQQQQCARHICIRPRTADGEHQYCSLTCKAISQAVHGPPLPTLDEWTWAPRYPLR